jgi:TRAP-type transport system small permease protein
MPRLLGRAYDLLLGALAALAALSLGTVTVLITLDVIGRNTGFGNLPWLNEVVEYTLYLATFLAAPWVLRQGAHVRMDLVVTLLPGRAARRLELATDLAGSAICLVLLWYAGRATLVAHARGSLIIKTLVLAEWWMLALLPLAFLLLAIEFLRRAAAALRGGAPVRTGHEGI